MIKAASYRGLFITFEGGEGSGKSTQARQLLAWLESSGVSAILTREPGGTELGLSIRAMVLDRRNEGLSSRAELLLYEADRAQHVDERIRPALVKGEVVICDRHADSSTVYQGICRGLGEKPTQGLNRFATGGLVPDLVFVLDIPESEGLGRVRRRADAGGLDRFEQEALAFHRKVRRGFLKLARANRSRYRVIDARVGQSTIAARIQEEVARKLKRRGLWSR